MRILSFAHLVVLISPELYRCANAERGHVRSFVSQQSPSKVIMLQGLTGIHFATDHGSRRVYVRSDEDSPE